MSGASTRAAVAAGALGSVVVAATVARAAEGHRIAAVDPDAELTHALDVALAPWGASVVEVRLQAPGATMPFAVDRARAIAQEAHADVVVWVSSAQGAYALWIYDAASDHIGSRGLEILPPFDPATAAAVALAVKTLLRGTVVAPALERFGAASAREAHWALGVDVGAMVRFGMPVLAEPRLGLMGAAWPAAWRHRWGVALSVETGPGAAVTTDAFAGSLRDGAARLAIAARVPLSIAAAVEASIGGAIHLVELYGVVRTDSTSTSITRFDAAVEPRVGARIKVFGGWLELTPWIGASILTPWQRYTVRGVRTVEVGTFGAQGALTAALALP